MKAKKSVLQTDGEDNAREELFHCIVERLSRIDQDYIFTKAVVVALVTLKKHYAKLKIEPNEFVERARFNFECMEVSENNGREPYLTYDDIAVLFENPPYSRPVDEYCVQFTERCKNGYMHSTFKKAGNAKKTAASSKRRKGHAGDELVGLEDLYAMSIMLCLMAMVLETFADESGKPLFRTKRLMNFLDFCAEEYMNTPFRSGNTREYLAQASKSYGDLGCLNMRGV